MKTTKAWQKQAIKERPLRIPTELHAKFKVKCVTEGRTMSWVTTQLIKKYLEENDA